MLCAFQGDVLWVLAIDCISKYEAKIHWKLVCEERPEFWVGHLISVWSDQGETLPPASKQKRREYDHHIQESIPFPSPCSSWLQPAWSQRGRNVCKGLKRNAGNWGCSVLFCVTQPMEASRRQPSIGAGISGIALIHSADVEARWYCSCGHFADRVGLGRS